MRTVSLLITLATVVAAHAASLEEDFHNPPHMARPGLWWHWMGANISQAGITKDLEAFKDAGFSSATIFGMADVCTPWAGKIGNCPTPDLVAFTDPWWEMVAHAAREAKRLGFEIGIHNAPGYDGSGGPWITPELSMQEIVHSERRVKGPGKFDGALARAVVDPRAQQQFPIYCGVTGKVEKPESPARQTFYRDIAVLAAPDQPVIPKDAVVDLTGKLRADGTLDWDVPAGDWIVWRFGYTSKGNFLQPAQWEANGLQCDKMNTAAVEFHLRHVLAAMRKHVGALVGDSLKHVLFDSYEAGDPTWTPKMREEFAARRKYDPTPWLPVLAKRVVGSDRESNQFKGDFGRTIRDLYRDCYFATIKRLLSAEGLEFQCEPYGGPWSGNEVFPLVDRVMTEFWTPAPGIGVRGVADEGRRAGKRVIEAEAFTGGPNNSAWTETPCFLKPAGDGAFANGVNRLVLHHGVHQPWADRFRPGNAMGQWGTHFGRLQTWWEPGKAWVAYLGRCQAMLQRGEPVTGAKGLVFGNLPAKVGLGWTHRRDGEADLFFVVNYSDRPVRTTGAFAVAGKQPELWDPVWGTMRPLPEFATAGSATKVPLGFAPRQSYFIVFRNPTAQHTGKNFVSYKPVADVNGPWEVAFDPNWGGPALAKFDKLDDWTKRPEPGIKYYSGAATYRTKFDGDTDVALDLGAVNHLARVRINGKDLGVVWCPPWRVNIPPGLLKATGNQLEIEVTNVWANRLIGDEQEPPDCEWSPGHMGHGGPLKQFPDWFVMGEPRPSKGRYGFTTWNYFKKDSPLVSSGLLGPVRLVSETEEVENEAVMTDVRNESLRQVLARAEDHCAHAGGGNDTRALFDGVTGGETVDDGETFRGYGGGDWLTLHLKQPCDIAGIHTYARHGDARASQRYAVLVAYAADPDKFVKLTNASKESDGGETELRLPVKANSVVAVRFEFQDGPLGFNVYREVNIVGTAERK